ncbi:uncharacterized protein LOC62_04G005398 [Vanrija pseudolonga]|uniref:Uncharacterized protein n=1 Tax=Vanrija pseudolonga TaxID=143232 RepID=A0AAF1BIR9_9TREE|nr:hypothetical protein LOC62_04G005398 [Vanrija pseudolonga]
MKVTVVAYNPILQIEATKAVYAANPAFRYDPSWSMAYFKSDAPNGIAVGPSGKGALGIAPNFSLFNSSSTGSFSLSFYGKLKVLNMFVTPLDPAQPTANVTYSLDGYTWTTEINATSMPMPANATTNTIWPTLDFGPLAPNMTMGSHNLTVTVGGVVASFRQMVIDRGFQTEANEHSTPGEDTFTDITDRTASYIPNQAAHLYAGSGRLNAAPNGPFICPSPGSWSNDTNSNGMNNNAMLGNPGASCSIQLPLNTTYLYVNGTGNYNRGTVTFRLSAPVPVPGFPAKVSTSIPYIFPLTLYETPLDPTLIYNLTIEVGNDGQVGIDMVQVWSSLSFGGPTVNITANAAGNPDQPSTRQGGGRTNVAAIAGGVVGGVVGALVIAGAIIWFLRRRQK